MKESIQHYIDHIEQAHDDQYTLMHNNRLSRELEKRAKLRGLRVVRLSGVLDLVAFGEGFSSQVKPGVSAYAAERTAIVVKRNCKCYGLSIGKKRICL